jgi:chromosome segregation ATPase
MSEVLLKILNETLNELAERMKAVQGAIEKHQGEMREKQKEVQLAEDRQKCATYEDEQAGQRIEVLRGYLTRLGKQPHALMNKMKILGDEQDRTAHARRVAGEQVVSPLQDLRSRQTRLAVLQQDHGELQKQWSEMSELISKAQIDERGSMST